VNIDQALKHKFKLDVFRLGQREIINAVVSGNDVMAVMPTGGGKSLCYQLPAYLKAGITVVISPLIALMNDQVRSLRDLGLPAGSIHSGISLAERKSVFQAMQQSIKENKGFVLYLSLMGKNDFETARVTTAQNRLQLSAMHGYNGVYYNKPIFLEYAKFNVSLSRYIDIYLGWDEQGGTGLRLTTGKDSKSFYYRFNSQGQFSKKQELSVILDQEWHQVELSLKNGLTLAIDGKTIANLPKVPQNRPRFFALKSGPGRTEVDNIFLRHQVGEVSESFRNDEYDLVIFLISSFFLIMLYLLFSPKLRSLRFLIAQFSLEIKNKKPIQIFRQLTLGFVLMFLLGSFYSFDYYYLSPFYFFSEKNTRNRREKSSVVLRKYAHFIFRSLIAD